MTVQPNGTDAKDIALHFVKATVGRATPSIMGKTIIQAKSLLSCDYTKEEVIKAIDYIIDVKKVEMYSLGYVASCINNVLKEIEAKESLEKAKVEKEKLDEEMKTLITREEVREDGESAERNRRKIAGLGIKSSADKYSGIFKE